jgi:hypothetical protein
MTTKKVDLRSICWRDNKTRCEKMMCCYNASCQAVFEYWKFANSEEWKRIVQIELEKEKVVQQR